MKTKLNFVLLVDDDDGTNYINKKVIEKTKITEQIEVTLNGKEAIDFIISTSKLLDEHSSEPTKTSLILLDLNMPVMDGWEFLEAYRNLSNKMKSSIVIIMLTTSLNPDDKLKAKNFSEISGFENKPLTFERMQDLLLEYFPDTEF
jgi:CheY-like chemotaxis protein